MPLNWSLLQNGVVGTTGAWQVPEVQASPLQQLPCPTPVQRVALPEVMQAPQVPAGPPPDGSTQIGAEVALQQLGAGWVGLGQLPPALMLQVGTGAETTSQRCVPELQVAGLQQSPSDAQAMALPSGMQDLQRLVPTGSVLLWVQYSSESVQHSPVSPMPSVQMPSCTETHPQRMVWVSTLLPSLDSATLLPESTVIVHALNPAFAGVQLYLADAPCDAVANSAGTAIGGCGIPG
jgi:hypothetical protein